MNKKAIVVLSIVCIVAMGVSFVGMAGAQIKSTIKTQEAARIVPKIDLNKATAEELGKCPGLNVVLGKAIVEYRTTSGLFKTPQDLLKVRGMTKEILNRIKPKVEKELLYITPVSNEDEEEDEPSLKPSKC
jgi:competence ComEA-like helix-hairpin-helix protein